VGGALGLLTLAETDAKKHKKHKKRKGGDARSEPPPPLVCSGGTTNCGGVCADLQHDAAHCGACGTICPAQQTCCEGVCRATLTDLSNCGICGTVCSGLDRACVAGRCCRPFNEICTVDAQWCSNSCFAPVACN
jgi:hypothetical protein